MVKNALDLMAGQLLAFIENRAIQSGHASMPDVKLDSIARAGSIAQRNRDLICISLINVKTGPTGRNFPIAFKDPKDAVHRDSSSGLQLDVLISFVAGNYENSLMYLSWTHAFFKDHPTFLFGMGEMGPNQVMIDAVNLTLEDVSNLWISMRMPPLPFLYYHVRIN